MPIPRLVHAVLVVVEQVDQGQTVLDPDFREPTSAGGATFKPGVSIRGQVKWVRKDSYTRAVAGDKLEADGHICFMQRDLDKIGLVLKRGDRVSIPSDQGSDYRFVGFDPAMHYGGKFWGVLGYFKKLQGS